MTSHGSEVEFKTLQVVNYTINVSANPNNGGSVTGGGTYQQGQTCTVKATSAAGYGFQKWTENGVQVSTNTNYSFTVNAINSSGGKVYFSKGNLQYKASTNTWQFAANQYDYIGNANSNISSSYSGWIDLFGWGTSGYNHGANCYQPWSTSQTDSDYYAYGQYTYDLYDQTGKADWGYNAISNGGNVSNRCSGKSVRLVCPAQ